MATTATALERPATEFVECDAPGCPARAVVTWSWAREDVALALAFCGHHSAVYAPKLEGNNWTPQVYTA